MQVRLGRLGQEWVGLGRLGRLERLVGEVKGDQVGQGCQEDWVGQVRCLDGLGMDGQGGQGFICICICRIHSACVVHSNCGSQFLVIKTCSHFGCHYVQSLVFVALNQFVVNPQSSYVVYELVVNSCLFAIKIVVNLYSETYSWNNSLQKQYFHFILFGNGTPQAFSTCPYRYLVAWISLVYL